MEIVEEKMHEDLINKKILATEIYTDGECEKNGNKTNAISNLKKNDIDSVCVPHEDGALPPLESLTCTLCSKYFTDSVTLPCMHSFCRKCLEEYNGRSLDLPVMNEDEIEEDNEGEENNQIDEYEDFDSENKMQNENVNNMNKDIGVKKSRSKKNKKVVKPLQCPTCKDKLKLKNSACFQVPFPNDRITRILRLLKESHILCQNCQNTSSELRCTVCDAYTCESCYHATHAAPIFKHHVPERLTHTEMTCPPRCESHKLNEIEYFTTDDELGVCQVCLLKGEFKGKEYSLVKDVRETRQAEIENGVSEALLQRAALIEGSKKVEKTKEELKNCLHNQVNAVKENFAAIREAVNERELETLSALKDLHDQKQKVLLNQLEAISIEKGRIEDGVKNVNLVLNHSNDLEVVYSSFVLQAHVSDLSDVPSTNPLSDKSVDGPDHDPAVDPELPVVLSDKVPQLVKAYASVADASLVKDIITGTKSKSALSSASVKGSKEQQEILQQVVGTSSKNVDGAEYGCSIQ